MHKPLDKSKFKTGNKITPYILQIRQCHEKEKKSKKLFQIRGDIDY